MPAYHKKFLESTTDASRAIDYPTLSSEALQAVIKGRFGSFCIAVGIQTVLTMMEQDVEEVVGKKNKHNRNRTAYRHGSQKTTIPTGSQRIAIERPRMRSVATGDELPVPSYEAFANDDELLGAALRRMLHGLSSREYRHGIDPVGEVAVSSGTSKSAISERFIRASAKEAQKVLGRRFDDQDIPVIMIDGIVLGDYTAIVAMGVTSDGQKIIMGVRIGSTENAQSCHDLLVDLAERGLRYEDGLLAIIDGSKALRKALKGVFGQHVLIQRCQVHKLRNVQGYLPKHQYAWVKRLLGKAWASETADEAIRELRSLATSLEHKHPDAAASLREGLEETVTILRMNLPGLLQRSLRSTNAIESAFSVAAKNLKNVKNWKNGDMVQRWVCSALLDAESRMHRIPGHRSMSVLMTEIKLLTTAEKTENNENRSKTA